ncbi:MAG: hypothetical protein JZD40_07320 [Sulfolobus sp.]|nr:hypothetical protein [Sulfolobus sp.]
MKLRNEQQLLLTPEEIVKIAGLEIVYLDEDRVTFKSKNREVTLYGWKLGDP